MDLHALEPWFRPAIAAAVAVVLALLLHRLMRALVWRVIRRSKLLSAIARRCDPAVQVLLPLVVLQLVWQGVPRDLPGLATLQHLNGVLAISVITWLLIAAVQGTADGVIARHPSNVVDNLNARRIQTQARVLSRIAGTVLLIAGLAFVLMTFPRARQLGASLLASAGVAGLVIGLAARSVFSNLLAGLQIALAQPLRIDDVLIVEGEWGRVEEITSTYVVLKIWDERRLIIPLQWFMDHPFQNWTRQSADLLGTVFLSVDYSLPVDAIRAEARRLCEASANWDRRVCGVQVTDASERCMQLRILVSAASSGQAFDLRCELREGLIAYVQREHPQSLPRLRAELSPDDPPHGAAGAAD